MSRREIWTRAAGYWMKVLSTWTIGKCQGPPLSGQVAVELRPYSIDKYNNKNVMVKQPDNKII